jgi:glycosyltransferase involved in cell wall biosynthesis
MRLGIYTDLVYHSDADGISTDQAFVEFILHLAPTLDEMVVFGRLDPTPGRSVYALPPTVAFVPLPHYPRTADPLAVARALRRSVAIFTREGARLDAVWLFGPHPIALAFALAARRHGTSVFLGVRQDFPRYIARRLPSRGWLWALPAAYLLEWGFRLTARRCPTIVVGADLARRYGGGSPVLASAFSLVREADISPANQVGVREWRPPVRILSVGRLDPEKNPLLLVNVLARLRHRSGGWHLTIVGEGQLGNDLQTLAHELGVSDAVEFTGYVPNGPALLELYRSSDVFLHVALTEGLPQVLFEAQACGLPVVATEVGGVGAALGHGERGLLVPPGDVEAAVAALEHLARDAHLRERVAAAGLAYVRQHTLEVETERIADFLREHASAR